MATYPLLKKSCGHCAQVSVKSGQKSGQNGQKRNQKWAEDFGENSRFWVKNTHFRLFSCPQIACFDQVGQKPTFFFKNFSEKKIGFYRKFVQNVQKVGKWPSWSKVVGIALNGGQK
ncbi:hypothetical protein SEA_MAKAI_88 [Arthrobacter phage Makai]|nr:hypothetical protein SEA_MAKAI_88 [Arthrobacter phage Makai]